MSNADEMESEALAVLVFTFLAVSAALSLVVLPTACSASDNSAPADVRLTAAPFVIVDRQSWTTTRCSGADSRSVAAAD